MPICNILQHFIGEIFGIPENVPRFLKNVFHIPDERQLGLASLLYLVSAADQAGLSITRSETRRPVFSPRGLYHIPKTNKYIFFEVSRKDKQAGVSADKKTTYLVT